MKDQIKNAVDRIEPEKDAKARMYRNITEKAASSAKNDPIRGSGNFTRVILPLAACICIMVLGAARFLPLGNWFGQDTYPSDSLEQGGNPYVEVENAAAFDKLGITLDAPNAAEDKAYAIIGGEIAEVEFRLDEHYYRLRASKGEDFSGISGETVSREPIENGKDAELVVMNVIGTGECRMIVWADGDVNFSLYNSDNASAEQLREVYEKIN